MSVINLLNETLQNKWSFETTMKIQDEMIPAMVEGKDIVAESPTGSVKHYNQNSKSTQNKLKQMQKY